MHERRGLRVLLVNLEQTKSFRLVGFSIPIAQPEEKELNSITLETLTKCSHILHNPLNPRVANICSNAN
jgi:hypothetical protein